jgi:peptide/nickel transport system substrate-binding protein
MGYSSTQPCYAYSPTLSAREFQQAWGDQVWSQGFSLTLAYNEGVYSRQRFVEVLAQSLEAIRGNFHVKVISETWPVHLDARRSRRLPAYVGGWLQDYHHPHNWVHPFLHSRGAYGGYQAFPEALASQIDAKIEACV